MLTSALRQKLDQARFVLEEMLDRYPLEQTMLAWSAGKDSTLVLYLLVELCRERGLRPPRVMDIDEKDAFPELGSFRDRLVRDWNLDLLIVRNIHLLDKLDRIGDELRVADLNPANQAALEALGYREPTLRWLPDSPACSLLLKTLPLRDALRDHAIQALITGIRWDEHVARSQETFFSPRNDPSHMRVQPILHFTERDVWDVTLGLGIPFCRLYSQGYRSLSTRSASKPSAAVPAWEQDLESSNERQERNLEKESVMGQLRALGYM
jgi:phosphoadenosine phosphosulfate reductase